MTALALDGLHMNFGALAVTRNVSLQLEAGARHALIGPNGAGKTTLVNLISGGLTPTRGTTRLGGVDVTRASRERRVALGLARTFQINSLFPSLSVAENIALAVGARAGVDALPVGRFAAHAPRRDEVERLLALLELERLAPKLVSAIPYGQRRLVEIALALALEPKVLLLDEPAAGLSQRDGAMLLRLLQRLPDGVAVLVIEHDMALVFQFAQRITVLVGGAILIEGTVEEVRRDPTVRDVYLGRRHG